MCHEEVGTAGVSDTWCLLLPALDIPSAGTCVAPLARHPLWLLQSSFLWWEHSPAPSLSNVLHVQI